MSKLSRTCKRLRDIVQPIVFQCSSDSGSREVNRMIRLARSLIERPDLAQHMRFVMLHTPLGELELSDRKFVQNSIVQLGLHAVPDHWNIDGDPDYRLLPLELALANTPNLEYLRMPIDCDWQLHLLEELLEKRGGVPFFPKLRALDIRHFFIAGDRFDVSSDAVDAIARAAPSLESLALSSPNGALNAPLPHLRRLRFHGNCCMSPEVLERILRSAPQLEALALPWDVLEDMGDMDDDDRTNEAWKAIACRKDTLRELELDIQGGMHYETVVEGERESLADFERLEVLKVDGHSLGALRTVWLRRNRHASVDDFLSGLLPPSIRELTFWELHGQEMKTALRRLAKVVAQGGYPNLESVVLAPSEAPDRPIFGEVFDAGEWDDVKDELVEEFRKAGVRFKVRPKKRLFSHLFS